MLYPFKKPKYTAAATVSATVTTANTGGPASKRPRVESATSESGTKNSVVYI